MAETRAPAVKPARASACAIGKAGYFTDEKEVGTSS